jgi:hypothetical protein
MKRITKIKNEDVAAAQRPTVQLPQLRLNNRVVVEHTEDRIERLFRISVCRLNMSQGSRLRGCDHEHQDFIVRKFGSLTAGPLRLRQSSRASVQEREWVG